MYLSRATEEQKARRDVVTHAEWGSPLSVEQFCLREQRLRAHPWSHAGMTTWLLCEDDGTVLASCETFRTDSFRRGPDGALVPGDSWAIASVFTEEPLRGRGHATRLMDGVAAELERSSPRAQSAVLFSDVGAPLYERSGYRVEPSWDWHLTALAGPLHEGVEALLHDGDVTTALARMRRPEAPFFLWPSPAQIDWHLERERIYAELLRRPRLEACGATVGDSTALWAMVARSNKLAVLMLDARSTAEAEALLGCARRLAARAGLERVELWEEPGNASLLSQVAFATRVPRDGSLPMVRPLRSEWPLSPPVPFPRALWV